MIHFTSSRSVLLFSLVPFVGGAVVKGSVVTFVNDYPGFLAAAGDVRIIDFETLPDGSPSHAGVEITPDFNYTSQGVAFRSPTGDPFIAGNSVSGFELAADGYPDRRTWIIATLTSPGTGVGIFGPAARFLSIYDSVGTFLGQVIGPDEALPWFVGIVSDVPIASALVDAHGTGAGILDFAFAPVPEPMTLVLLLTGMLAVVRRRPPK